MPCKTPRSRGTTCSRASMLECDSRCCTLLDRTAGRRPSSAGDTQGVGLPTHAGRQTRGPLERLDVDGLGPLVALLGVVADLGTLGERLEAVADDAGVVDEQVLGLVVGRDEPEALVVAEPFHGSGSHSCFLRCCVLRTR